MDKNKCEVCNSNGFLVIFNTDRKKLEIQRCDDCQIFKNDELAEQEALKFFQKVLQYTSQQPKHEEIMSYINM